MPTTIHRLCIWYIMKKIPHKLNSYKRHEEIQQEINAFDRNWNDFVTKYGVVDNKWLSASGFIRYFELFEDRHFWILIYVDHHFWKAKSKKTENLILQIFILSCLVQHSQIKAQFQHVYTYAKFREVQAQFREKVNCIIRSTKSALGFMACEVLEQSAYDNVMIEMQEYKAKSKEKYFLSHEDAFLDQINNLQSLPRLNLLNGGSMMQPNSTLYREQIMNYQFRDRMQ
ncbi:hypothetical protein Ahy_A09g045495 [Arachis hypogaea]|uniref:Protein FAR1-RELATED SEQUENCE n=1 Tax=Arachis hypogaea TaxID=3818 RepID=A0A445BMI2_ARAHY|nr:hypothetical protein Ahy_A09g045495 [Arachis hypogaea]